MLLPELREKAVALDSKKPVAVYCESGYRASIGTSILKQEGFLKVSNVPGGWQGRGRRRSSPSQEEVMTHEVVSVSDAVVAAHVGARS